MIAYPMDSRDTLPKSVQQISASYFHVPKHFPLSMGLVCALLAATGAYCAYVAETTPWPVLARVGLPLMLLTVFAMSLAVLTSVKALELLAYLKQFAAAIEQHDADGTMAVLSESGPTTIARLARAINGAVRLRADRQAELLHILAAYAHDQRTPLTRMGMRCEQVEDAALRNALHRDLAEMAELVEASLSCARLQCSVEEPTRRVDADRLLGTLIEDYRDAGRDVELEGCIGRPVVTCPHALRRVLMNLIDNALRYGGDVRLCVRIEARRLVFAVVDSGPGIVAEQMDAVFAPWYRAPDAAARAPGSGLGLAIARRLTLAMRGDLQLENRRTGGLEARVTLPFVTH